MALLTSMGERAVPDWAVRWINEVDGAIAGKRNVIVLMVKASLSEGHVLLEDKPGVGKTTLVQALAAAASCSFRRIQFTPDLLPGDITGVTIVKPATMELEYKPGPLNAQLVLADELNRASPRTQSALLEAMGERAVTVDGTTYPLPQPFMLLATQNPLRHEGTYALPEAQMDRFLFRLSVGYPAAEQEVHMLDNVRLTRPLERIQPVVAPDMIAAMQQAVRLVYVDTSVKQYIVALANATRAHSELESGISPRASIALMRAGQATAWMEGRDYVIPDDIKSVSASVMLHRLHMKSAARMASGSKEALLSGLLKSVPVPGGRTWLEGTSLMKRGGRMR